MPHVDPMDPPRRFTFEHPGGPRADVHGVLWFACDPYPTWYRWDDNAVGDDRLIVRSPDFPPLDEEPPRRRRGKGKGKRCPTCGVASHA